MSLDRFYKRIIYIFRISSYFFYKNYYNENVLVKSKSILNFILGFELFLYSRILVFSTMRFVKIRNFSGDFHVFSGIVL